MLRLASVAFEVITAQCTRHADKAITLVSADSPVVVNAGDRHDGVNDPEVNHSRHRDRDAVLAQNLRTTESAYLTARRAQ